MCKCLKYSVRIFVEYIYKMERLDVSGALRHIYVSLGFKRLKCLLFHTYCVSINLSIVAHILCEH